MAASKNGFVNEKILPIEIESAGLKGTVTVPVMMTEEQLDKYMRQSRENYKAIEAVTDEDGELKMGQEFPNRNEMARKLIAHLVLDIDFPGVTLESIKTGEPRPFPAVIYELQRALKPTIDDGTNLKN